MVDKKNLFCLISAYYTFTKLRSLLSNFQTQNSQNNPCDLTLTHASPVSLVFVGSGPLEKSLQLYALSLGLNVFSSSSSVHASLDDPESSENHLSSSDCQSDTLQPLHLSRLTFPNQNNDYLTFSDSATFTPASGSVYFLGFRQIDQNPIFYSLAEMFVLPSKSEEWGLVVNEAMASSLPVVVSKAAGCAEDLLPLTSSLPSTISNLSNSASMVDTLYDTISVRLSAQFHSLNLPNLFSASSSLVQCSNGFTFDPDSSDDLALAILCLAESAELRSCMGGLSLDIINNFSCSNFARQVQSIVDAFSGDSGPLP
ncbi:MAG: glycosyltransferase [bacterium]